MARLLMKALGTANFAPTLASELRTLDMAGDPAAQQRLKHESELEADRLIATYRAFPDAERPRLWFTYHVYYKAPDWIGPHVADALGVPYVVAEASRAPKRATGSWALGHQGAEAALDRADVLFVMTDTDRAALECAKRPAQRLVDLPPFLDRSDWENRSRLPGRVPIGAPRLLTVAMMREGDKLDSYEILAQALARIRHLPWSLDVVGDGEARDTVRELFAAFGRRITFHGQIEDGAVLRHLYAAADLFVWPAVNEAYGMALLEAQASGCPVVAGAYGGVPAVVRPGETGLLTPPGDTAAFGDAVADLLRDPLRRARLSAAAHGYVMREHGLEQAASRLRTGLNEVLQGNP